MKWFKHDTDASRSEAVIELEKEFGVWGYAAWFKLLERIAEKMDKTDRCHAKYPETEWARMLRCKPKILRTFLERCENVMIIKVERSDNVIKIEIPKLLEKRDDYTRKSGQSPDKVHLDTDTDKDIYSSKEKFPKKKVGELFSPPHVAPAAQPKKSRIPKDMVLTDEYRQIAINAGINGSIELVFEEFVSYWQGSGITRADWKATWRNNCIKEAKKQKPERLGVKYISKGGEF